MKGVVDRFSEEFVETRMKALDKFLKRVADHPVLSFNPYLNAFLTAKVGPQSTKSPVNQPQYTMRESNPTDTWIRGEKKIKKAKLYIFMHSQSKSTLC